MTIDKENKIVTLDKWDLNVKPGRLLREGKISAYDINYSDIHSSIRTKLSDQFSAVFTYNGKSKILRYNG